MELEIRTPPDFSFYETLHAHGWRHLLPFAWDEDRLQLQRIEQFADGKIALMTLTASDHAVRVACSEEVPRAELQCKVRRMLQLDVDLTEFYRFCAARPELTHIPRDCKGRMLSSPSVYEDVCKVILTTNTTWTQTKAMNGRLISEFGDLWSADPGRHAFPRPERIAATPFDEFAARTKLGYRAAAVHSLSTEIAQGGLDLESLHDPEHDAETVRKRLLALRGVGPYAAACLMLYMGRPALVNADSWARTLLSKELGRLVSDKEVHDYFAQYAPWQGLVYNFYPWSHENAPPAPTDIPASAKHSA